METCWLLTKIHDVVPADGAVVDDDVPRPERNGVPLQSPRLATDSQPRQGAARARRLEHTFLTSKRFFPPLLSASPAAALFFLAIGAATGASVISTSAMAKAWAETRVEVGTSDEDTVCRNDRGGSVVRTESICNAVDGL